MRREDENAIFEEKPVRRPRNTGPQRKERIWLRKLINYSMTNGHIIFMSIICVMVVIAVCGVMKGFLCPDAVTSAASMPWYCGKRHWSGLS